METLDASKAATATRPKRTYGRGLRLATFRVSAEQYEKCRRLGGEAGASAWLRALIDAAPEAGASTQTV
ncbi:hypothetical protein ACLKMY_32895 [Paraburkholderia mimosarum]|uniref:hypothetical protein n=1 Tax=Paraburkholderia mimosarum TaxID=312026 RepID=UPI0039C39917